MSNLLQQLLDRGDLIGFVAITGTFFVAVMWIVFGTLQGISKTRAREQTRREIAAYVASGSLKTDDAVAILNAGRSRKSCCGEIDAAADTVVS